jgi:hypothetical protein
LIRPDENLLWLSLKRKLVMLLVRLNLKTNGMVQKKTEGFGKKIDF